MFLSAPRVHSFEQLALMWSDRKFNRLSTALTQTESTYRDAGLLYFAIPAQARDHILSTLDPTAAIDPTAASSPGQPPDLIRFIALARQYRASAGTSLQAYDKEAADDTLIMLEDVLEQIAGPVDAVAALLSCIEAAFWDTQFTEHGAYGLPIDPTMDGYAKLRSWVLALPEVQNGVQQGFASEDEIFAVVVRKDLGRFFSVREGSASRGRSLMNSEALLPAVDDDVWTHSLVRETARARVAVALAERELSRKS